MFGKALANAEEDAFLNGSGVGQPLGLFAATGGGTAAISTASLTADDVIKLVYALKRPYRKNAKFIMNDQTIASIRQLKDNNGAYMWQPSLVAGEPDKLWAMMSTLLRSALLERLPSVITATTTSEIVVLVPSSSSQSSLLEMA